MSMKLAEERVSRVLGISSLGFPIYPIAGAEGDDDGNDGGNGNSGGGNGDGGGDGGNGNGDGGGSSDNGNGTELNTVSAEQYAQLEARLAAADKAKGQLQQKLNEIDQANLSEQDKVAKALENANKRIADLEEKLTGSKMSNAILQYPGYTWHDPEMVLKAIDMSRIEIDEETGKVSGVKEALERLAKEKSFLLKGKENDGGNGGGKSGGQKNNRNGSGGGSSGGNPGSGGKPDDKNARRSELEKKYKL